MLHPHRDQVTTLNLIAERHDSSHIRLPSHQVAIRSLTKIVHSIIVMYSFIKPLAIRSSSGIGGLTFQKKTSRQKRYTLAATLRDTGHPVLIGPFALPPLPHFVPIPSPYS
jgi:hypothetical protein